MAFELPALPYAQDALAPHISAETLEYHYGKHHKTYVDNLNKLVAGTPDEDASLTDVIAKAEGGLFNNAAQTWNHTFFWNSLSPTGGGAPTGEIADRINADLGGYDAFRAAIVEAGLTQFGSGWAWLVDEGGKLAVMKTANADLPMKHGPRRCSPSTSGSTPTTSTTATRGPSSSTWCSTTSSIGTSPTRTWPPEPPVDPLAGAPFAGALSRPAGAVREPVRWLP